VRNYPLKAGDAVVLETGGGGGWGPPSERARESIERDIARGYVSREAAERDYGMTL
jgi:N-methylhydantoinase B